MKISLRQRQRHRKNKLIIIACHSYGVVKCHVRNRWQYTFIPNDPGHGGYCVTCGGRL